MQTLISQIETEINKGGNGSMAIGFDYGLKKAKQLAEELLEMEKEQTIKGILDNRNITSQVTYLDAAEYFDRTFKQEQ